MRRRLFLLGLTLLIVGLTPLNAAAGEGRPDSPHGDAVTDAAPPSKRPSDVRPTDVRPSDVRPSDVRCDSVTGAELLRCRCLRAHGADVVDFDLCRCRLLHDGLDFDVCRCRVIEHTHGHPHRRCIRHDHPRHLLGVRSFLATIA